jgi:hypothetical protein
MLTLRCVEESRDRCSKLYKAVPLYATPLWFDPRGPIWAVAFSDVLPSLPIKATWPYGTIIEEANALSRTWTKPVQRAAKKQPRFAGAPAEGYP